jgi:hypothetical protein
MSIAFGKNPDHSSACFCRPFAGRACDATESAVQDDRA